MALLGLVIGSVHSPIVITGYKIHLHTTTCLITSHEPIVVLPQKFYYIYTMTQLLFTNKFKELSSSF